LILSTGIEGSGACKGTTGDLGSNESAHESDYSPYYDRH